MTIVERAKAEQEGGRLPLYMPREQPDPVAFGKVGDLACFYCGFGLTEGHDSACRWLWWSSVDGGSLHWTRQEDGNIMFDVPRGGLKPSQSFF